MRAEGHLAGLYYTLFEPDQPTKATLLLLHGMAKHHQRYAAFTQYLAAQGFAVLAYDGAGRTAQNDAERSFF